MLVDNFLRAAQEEYNGLQGFAWNRPAIDTFITAESDHGKHNYVNSAVRAFQWNEALTILQLTTPTDSYLL